LLVCWEGGGLLYDLREDGRESHARATLSLNRDCAPI